MKTTLELNHTYLISEDKWTNYPLIYKATVVDVTETCYQLKRENGNTSWELQEKVASKWKVIEDLGDLITPLRTLKKELDDLKTDWGRDKYITVYIKIRYKENYSKQELFNLMWDGSIFSTTLTRLSARILKTDNIAEKIETFKKDNPHIDVYDVTINTHDL